MRAVMIREFGSRGAVAVEEIEDPDPGRHRALEFGVLHRKVSYWGKEALNI